MTDVKVETLEDGNVHIETEEDDLVLTNDELSSLVEQLPEKTLDSIQWDVVRAVYEWYDVLEDWKGPDAPPSTSTRFIIDAEHSALLKWLMKGNEPLPLPPPKYMSRPWHQLVKDGEGRCMGSVMDDERFMKEGEEIELRLGQHSWKVHETLGDNEFVASWYYRDPVEGYVAHPSRWRVSKDEDSDPSWPTWNLKRIEE